MLLVLLTHGPQKYTLLCWKLWAHQDNPKASYTFSHKDLFSEYLHQKIYSREQCPTLNIRHENQPMSLVPCQNQNLEDFCLSTVCPLQTIKNQKPRADAVWKQQLKQHSSVLCPDRGYSAARDIKAAQTGCCPPVSESSDMHTTRRGWCISDCKKAKNPLELELGMTFCLELSTMET